MMARLASPGIRLPLVLLLAALPLAPVRGEASCAAPTVGASPNDRRAGDLVLVTGEDWGGSCADSQSCGACGKCTTEEDGGAPVREVTILLERAGTDGPPVELDTIDLDGRSSFAAEIRLPRRLRPGHYFVTALGDPAGERSRTPLRIVR